jgi:hypothetical protein
MASKHVTVGFLGNGHAHNNRKVHWKWNFLLDLYQEHCGASHAMDTSPCKELNARIEETQLEYQTSLNTET